MELWDTLDIDRQLTGGKMVRGEPIKEGEHHLVIHVCIFNKQGEMLIQQRQPFKEGWPNMWDVSTGGSAVAGDTSQTAAHREVLEELGLSIDFTGIRPQMTINFPGGFDDMYFIEREVNIDDVILQPEEVQAVKWASHDEICEMIDDGRFIPYHKALIRLMFDMRERYGTIQA
ncbi:MAG: NUDIX domain-containing protein [Oscillospiraceae bacterium]|nr:NUDIX domain-containing protein [Oscillospiraceae bacterium]